MLDICYEALEDLKEDAKTEDFIAYLDTWDYEEEYSHNHIEENRDKFTVLANEFFETNNLPFVARECCENVRIFSKEN